MLRSMIQAKNESFAHDPSLRGYCPVYRENRVNHCPGCGRTQWYVGRISAECGFCATALPLAEASSRGAGLSRGHNPVFFTSRPAGA
ncbi:hypothetical protein [Allosphingosinicella sp.]|uniref:hypothetical protein n=1 Tax=Allosphingosinicella sp. TaxID=2823234 RepID=UPI002EE68F9E